MVYAQLCRVLSKVSVEVGAGPDVKKKTFRSLLLIKCQQEYLRRTKNQIRQLLN